MNKHETQSGGNYLHVCLGLHGKVTKLRYGRTQNLSEIEAAVSSIRSSHRLTYSDVEAIRNSKIWNADMFGFWPSKEEFESSKGNKELNLHDLPNDEDNIIKSLLSVFRQILVVSVILRFACPEHYGILSPPIETILGIGPYRFRHEKYISCLKNLRELRRHSAFNPAKSPVDTAKVDMALWALQLGVIDGRLKSCLPEDEFDRLWEGYKQDSMLRKIRVRNLTKQLFDDMKRPELAEALYATNRELSAQIAGIEFEKFVRMITRANSHDKLSDLVENGCSKLPETKEYINEWKSAVLTRNKAIHSSSYDKLTYKNIKELIKAMKDVRDILKRRGEY